MLLSEELYQENLEMLDRMNSKKGVSFPYLVYGTKRCRNTDSREHSLYLMPSQAPLFHTFLYSSLRMCRSFVNIWGQTVGKGARQERKILSRVVNQNAAHEKNKPVSISSFNRCLHINQTQKEKNGESHLCCRKNSRLPVLLRSVPLTFPHTGKYTSCRSFMDDPYRD